MNFFCCDGNSVLLFSLDKYKKYKIFKHPNQQYLVKENTYDIMKIKTDIFIFSTNSGHHVLIDVKKNQILLQLNFKANIFCYPFKESVFSKLNRDYVIMKAVNRLFLFNLKSFEIVELVNYEDNTKFHTMQRILTLKNNQFFYAHQKVTNQTWLLSLRKYQVNY